MRRTLLVLASVLALVVVPSPPTAAAGAQVSRVTPWIELELGAIASHRLNPPRASRALGYLSRAMFVAANVRGDPRDNAVAGAASTVMRFFHPDEEVRISALVADLADTDSRAFDLGSAIGRFYVARAENDGADQIWTGTPPSGPGSWIPTPPAYVYPPLEPLAGTWRPWNLDTGSQFRPAPPPAYGSPSFLAEMNEVYAVSQTLTDEKRQIANRWADGAGTVTPSGHWNLIAIDLIDAAGWSTARSAEVFSALNTAQADAFIACWDAKYTYWTLRPITAINGLIDPDWRSYIVTPPFPSYVSGHSTTSGAASTVLGAYFPKQAEQLRQMAEEAAISRLYGGIHFQSDNTAGLALGRQIGAVAVHAYDVVPD
jgi:PAP2 superfamily